MINVSYAEWIGLTVKQVSCDSPEYQKHVGRVSVVKDVIVDEEGNAHIQTEDGIWCPSRLLEQA